MGLACDTPDANDAPRAQYSEVGPSKKQPIMVIDYHDIEVGNQAKNIEENKLSMTPDEGEGTTVDGKTEKALPKSHTVDVPRLTGSI